MEIKYYYKDWLKAQDGRWYLLEVEYGIPDRLWIDGVEYFNAHGN